MQTFRINEYLEVRLEGKNTNIYVKGKPIRTCKYLLLNIPAEEIETFDEIESIDEAAVKLDHQLHSKRIPLIPPEVEFWGHCSNLQVWAENNYDTRLIHSNLAFPLLEQIYQEGNSVATKVFKEEIAKRYESGYQPVIEYLREKNFLRLLSTAELSAVGIDPKFFLKDGHLDIMILGDVGVGKRTLIDYLIDGEYKDASARSPKLADVSLFVQHKWLTVDETPYLYFFYTFANSLLEKPMFLHLFRRTLGIILVYDITNRQSFNNLSRWVPFVQDIFKGREMAPILLVGTKSDLENERVVNREEGEKVMERYKLLDHYECSAKHGENTKGIFEKLAQTIIHKMTL